MSKLVDWSPDSDYDVVKTNDPDGKKWRKMLFGGENDNRPY